MARPGCAALACCKVGLDRPLTPTAVIANLFRSARVFRWGAAGRGLGDRRSQRTWGGVRRPLPEPACTRKKPVPEGPAQTMASPQAVAAFRVQALERSRFAVGRLPAAYGDWSAR